MRSWFLYLKELICFFLIDPTIYTFKYSMQLNTIYCIEYLILYNLCNSIQSIQLNILFYLRWFYCLFLLRTCQWHRPRFVFLSVQSNRSLAGLIVAQNKSTFILVFLWLWGPCGSVVASMKWQTVLCNMHTQTLKSSGVVALTLPSFLLKV